MPILKEFDLDLPYIVNDERIKNIARDLGFEHTEAIHYDYQNFWKEKRMRFRDEIRCIASLYERFFEKFKTENVWKIMPSCVSEITREEPIIVGGVYEVQVLCDIESYFKLDDYEKKINTLDLLKTGIDKIIHVTNWDRTGFDKAYNKVKQSNYINTWRWKKPIKSPNKKYTAEIFCEHNVSIFSIFIIIKDMNGNVTKQKMIKSDKPNEFDFAKQLGQLNWLTDHEVSLINKDCTEQWCVNVQD